MGIAVLEGQLKAAIKMIVTRMGKNAANAYIKLQPPHISKLKKMEIFALFLFFSLPSFSFPSVI